MRSRIQRGCQGNQKTIKSKDRSKFWEWLTFIGLLIIIFLGMTLWYRWLRPDPDFLAFSTGVVELVAIASFLGLQTEGGRKIVLRIDDTLGLGRLINSPGKATLVVWGIVGMLYIFLVFGSPQAAKWYRLRGVGALEAGEYSRAIWDFSRAISLEPDSATTRYNLASAYEELHNYKKAIAEYQQSIELDDSFWPAYNNLGRLYLLSANDPDAALGTLMAGERRTEDSLGQAIMMKNIAWAYYEKGMPLTAVSTIRATIEALKSLQSEGNNVEIYLAEIYNLLARAHALVGDQKQAQIAYNDSLGYALAVAESQACRTSGIRLAPDCLSAIRWAAEAREAVYEREGEP
ncbi:MAG: tetratricopeptide repeat protein [Anaerolineales bacterium]|nr:tetratricopeptide repeat protein [Anaerolineales bacterium]